MKIAVPTRGDVVENHFGQCDIYTILTIDNQNKIEKTEILPSPQGCGCKSDIAATLRQIGVDTMLAGNMGQGALNTLTHQGIQVIRGNSGNINQVVENFLSGNAIDSGITCAQHEHHHPDDHHHGEEGHSCSHNHHG